MPVECGFHHERKGNELLAEIGPVLQVVIGFPPQHNAAPDGQSHPSSMETQALIDTGARGNHIDDIIARALHLPSINRQIVYGSNGSHEVDVYLAQIHIPALKETIFGQFRGVKLIEGGSKHGALLGRSFLQKVRMNYNGLTGQVTVTKAEEKPA